MLPDSKCLRRTQTSLYSQSCDREISSELSSLAPPAIRSSKMTRPKVTFPHLPQNCSQHKSNSPRATETKQPLTMMKFSLPFSALIALLLTTLTSAQQDTYNYTDVFVVEVSGTGYDNVTQAKAFNDVIQVFEQYFGSYQSYPPGAVIQVRRLSEELPAEDKVLEELTNLRGSVKESNAERRLFSTCPKSCSTKWTTQCSWECGTKTGRRLRDMDERELKNFHFSYNKCEAAMKQAVHPYNKMPGVQMVANLSILN